MISKMFKSVGNVTVWGLIIEGENHIKAIKYAFVIYVFLCFLELQPYIKNVILKSNSNNLCFMIALNVLFIMIMWFVWNYTNVRN